MSTSLIAIWIRRGLLGFATVLVIVVATLMIYQRFSDGPTGPLPGGPFRTGEVVSAPVDDWSRLRGDFEFELVGDGTSRTAGGIWLDGNVYISCDLGFMWSRLPSGTIRNILHVIWWFKTWHSRASEDGRVRIRKAGRIYPVTIERVHDPDLIEALKATVEVEAAAFFAPMKIGPRPQQPPSDMWFFRVTQ